MIVPRTPEPLPALAAPDPAIEVMGPRRRFGLVTGPLLFALILVMPIAGLDRAAQGVLAVGCLMAVWWLTEALPLAATSLLPIPLFPLLGIKSTAATTPAYMDRNIVLFMGGFFIAMAMQRWRLHRRIALWIVSAVGTGGRRLVLGFMVATAFLSMWISNTATAMMMLPIALAVILEVAPDLHEPHPEKGLRSVAEDPTAAALLLGVAYAASIGGIATLVGTPPNIVFATALTTLYPGAPPIGFFQWMMVGLPLSALFLFLGWLYLTRIAWKVPREPVGEGSVESLRQQRLALGPLSRGELGVAVIFLLTAVAWVWRADLEFGIVTIPGWTSLLHLEGVDDATVAVAAAILLFAIPTSLKEGHFLLDWHWARRIPWGVLLLFGGGIALAGGFAETGLAAWVGSRLQVLGQVPILVMVILVCTLITFLTEVTSNTATATVFMPVMAATAVALGQNPLLIMIPAAISASCAFMLPVATPPNAIIFGSGRITLPEMASTGFAMNWLGVVLITFLVYLIAIPVFGIVLGALPPWV
jgi:sodium-dependent dicarboxylate transporter 2/3/5